MNKDEIRALLLRIVNETSFRDNLIYDPVQTLAQIGITLDPCEVPATICLPSDQDILDKLDEFTDTVANCMSHIQILLQLGT